jgi:ribosome biogenesis protein NSA1
MWYTYNSSQLYSHRTSSSQALVSDHGCNLFALDLRNGKISYGYKGLSGAVTSIATSPTLLVSAAEDRFLRLHSTFPPPPQISQQQEQKGEVLDKLYMKVKPTVVIWDELTDATAEDDIAAKVEGSEDEDGDDVWDKLENVDSEDDLVGRKKSRAR